ncbi:MAG: Trm112 family protein [Pseudomonadales bacterium]|nr:Trm112 family protein [Pseudomonadales bacterium]
MAVDNKLIAILVCPLCKGKLKYDRDAQELICRADGLAYPIKDDIPVMLENEARELNANEKLSKD